MIRPCPVTNLIATPSFLCSNPDDATIIGITTLLFDLLLALDSDHDNSFGSTTIITVTSGFIKTIS